MSKQPIYPWYDRNPITKVDHSLELAVAPHPSTQRILYTVPVGKKAMVNALNVKIERHTAATTASLMDASFGLTLKDGTYQLILQAMIFTNNVGDADRDQCGSFLLSEGEKLHGITIDLSTDGKGNYFLSYQLTEFDAFPSEKPSPTRMEFPDVDVQEPEEKPWWWPF